MTPLGYPSEEPEPRPRKKLSEFASFETFLEKGGIMMPFIIIEAGKMDKDKKEKLISGFTKLASETLCIAESSFTVLIKENEMDIWALVARCLVTFWQAEGNNFYQVPWPSNGLPVMMGLSFGSSPVTLKIFVTSKHSSQLRGGRIDGRRRASIVLPVPGGPTRSTLWPPAAAISSARLTFS